MSDPVHVGALVRQMLERLAADCCLSCGRPLAELDLEHRLRRCAPDPGAAFARLEGCACAICEPVEERRRGH